ncbi:MAG: nitroreductase [Sediminimonas qiaohouensis]|uniref:Putative NAD(P)H nitroreductase n=1 Tax=Sediminimonas qiaohouensis TaxID=552061 RepID=A0A7C9H942_9RHOB|nr:nitroreductase [Sediminimonas qiaohouensis]MTJ03131.1 nitroreductase [Sediminimonas qiaohouensis]
MPAPDPAAMAFLLSRRSRPAKTLTAPGPDRAALEPILRAALRSPDHGKLEPWRLIVIERGALDRLAAAARARGAALGLPERDIDKGAGQFEDSPLTVAVVAAPKPSDKVPEIEQLNSAAAVCLSLLNAALASGWGANWLTGWPAHDSLFLTESLGLAPHERLTGFVHIGTETTTPPNRPRPNPKEVVTWLSE